MRHVNRLKLFFLVSLIACFSLIVSADKDEREEREEKTSAAAAAEVTVPPALYEEINREYMAEIKPLLQSKCFDCHSDQTKYPWYYKLPLVKQVMDHHIEEGREYLELSRDYPFGGKEKSVKQLKEIREEVEENAMPPLYYRMMHSNASFTDAEKQKVFKWIDQSIEKLNLNLQK